MPTMKSVRTAAPGTIEVAEIQRPAPAPGTCWYGYAPAASAVPTRPSCRWEACRWPREGRRHPSRSGTSAGEVVEIGAEVTGLKTGDRVVVNPQAAPSGIIGCGGTLGGMSEYLLIQNAVAGKSVAVFPDDLPFEVAALNEPMAVARHCVNRSQARTATRSWSSAPGPSGSGR